MTIRLCIAGATGWTGSRLVEAVLDSSEFQLVGAVAREAAGRDPGERLGRDPVGWSIAGSVAEALAVETDVLIDYTHPSVVKDHVNVALDHKVGAVIGTSGLSSSDYDEIEARAKQQGVGVVAAGNFSVTAALVKHFACIAARHVPHWEVLDYAHAGKPDAPSGTARELAETLATVAEQQFEVSPDQTVGDRQARGATIGGSQVHSIRLPGHVLSFEALFGLPDERLTIRHDAGSSAAPYVGGTLLAAKRCAEMVGLLRGMDRLLFGDSTPS